MYVLSPVLFTSYLATEPKNFFSDMSKDNRDHLI